MVLVLSGSGGLTGAASPRPRPRPHMSESGVVSASGSGSGSGSPPGWFMRHYFACIHRGRYVWIGWWLLVLIISGVFGLRFLDSTRDAFDAPKGTAAYDAHQTFRHDFPDKADVNNMVILVSALRAGDVVDSSVNEVDRVRNVSYPPLAWQLTNHVCDRVLAYEVPNLVKSCIGYYTYNSTGSPLSPDFPGFLWVVGKQFVNQNRTMTMILINYKFVDRNLSNRLIRDVRAYIAQVGNPEPDRWTVGLTGTDVLFLDTTEETAADMIRMDSIVIPIAFFVLAFYLKSIRLLLIPALSVGCSLLSSFAVMYPVADSLMSVASFTPSVMMSLVIAMSIDYSLFLLTRYREEILAGHSDVESVFNMLRFAGHVVFVSGSTLALSFTGLTFFPFDFLRSVGLGCCLALALTMLINLTLTPSLLLAFPKFFHDFSVAACLHRVLPRWFLDDVPKVKNIDESEYDSLGSSLLSPAAGGGGGDGDGHDSESAHDRARQKQLSSFWYRSAKLSTTTVYSCLLILFVLGISLPSAVQVLTMKHTMDNTQLFPRHAQSLQTFKQIEGPGGFSPGLLGPFQIIVTTPHDQGILNDHYFNATHSVIRSLLTRFPSSLSPSSITSISFVGLDAPWLANLTVWCRASHLLDPSLCPTIDPQDGNVYLTYNQSAYAQQYWIAGVHDNIYQYIWANQTNVAQSASMITISTRFDPLSEEAEPFVAATRSLLQQFTSQPNNTYGYYLTGSTVDEIDNVNAIFALFPVMVAATTGAVFAVVLVIFRSVFVPVRAVLTIGLAVAVTYGFGTLVFQQHKFDWASDSLTDVNSLFWLTPIMSFSILVGLGLDYDIFLFSRIVEYRRSGFTDRAAILKGVYKTGGIITGAGLIMAISFGGLMMSSEMVLNEFGFLMCLAVLFDTFVVRTALVPAIIHLAGKANWWPGGMPEAWRDELDQNDLESDVAPASRAAMGVGHDSPVDGQDADVDVYGDLGLGHGVGVGVGAGVGVHVRHESARNINSPSHGAGKRAMH